MRKFWLLILLVAAMSPQAMGQDTPQPLPLAQSGAMPQDTLDKLSTLKAEAMDEAEPIRLSPDGPAIIKLNEDAGSVVIGNPAHATALLENPRMMMLVPQAPGATKVMVLNREGKAILNRHVLVGTGRSGFMRVNRVCALSSGGQCAPVSMYYCPDKCYETSVPESGAGLSGASGALSNPPSDESNYSDAPEDAGVHAQEATSILQ